MSVSRLSNRFPELRVLLQRLLFIKRSRAERGGITMVMINVQDLVKRYGDLVALDHFNLQVPEGEIVGLLGPNGSGKTTSINCILALLKYDKGTVEVFGKPMTPDAYDRKRNIGVVVHIVKNQSKICGHRL